MDIYSTTKPFSDSTPLEVIKKYNLIVQSEASQQKSHVEGRVAVGQNAKFESFGVGAAIGDPHNKPNPPYGTDPTLVVGGNLFWNQGSNYGGNTVMTPSGNYDVKKVTYANANSNKQPIRVNKLPINFEELFLYFKSAANKWADTESEQGTTEVLNCYGNIYMIGLNKDINIFNISVSRIAPPKNIVGFGGNSLLDIYGITIIAPEKSTILINVSGNTVNFGNYSITRSTKIPRILPTPSEQSCKELTPGNIPTEEEKRLLFWNFHNANSISTSKMNFQGTLFAPSATVYTLAGSIEGGVIVNKYVPKLIKDNHTEVHNFLFNGNLPKNQCPTTTTHCPTTTTTHCPTTTTHCPTTTTHCPTTTTHCPTTTTHCPTTTTHCPTTTTHCPTTTTHCPTTTTHCPTTTTHCPTTTTHCPTTTTTHCPTTTTTHCPITTPCTTSTTTYPYYCNWLLRLIRRILQALTETVACAIAITILVIIAIIIFILLL